MGLDHLAYVLAKEYPHTGRRPHPQAVEAWLAEGLRFGRIKLGDAAAIAEGCRREARLAAEETDEWRPKPRLLRTWLKEYGWRDEIEEPVDEADAALAALEAEVQKTQQRLRQGRKG